MLNTKLLGAFLVGVLLALILFWVVTPRTVRAQQTAAPIQPACTTAVSAQAQAQLGGVTSGTYPIFACTADLDGTGVSEVIVGFVSSGIPPNPPASVYKVAIINNNGAVRATVPIN